jgi:four helix bundle protein
MPTHLNESLQTLSDPTFPARRSEPTPTPAPAPAPTISLPFQRLDVYVAARELARLVCTATIADAELRDQATRAVKSAFLNLAEGLPDDRPAVRRRYFKQADGSVHEVVAAVDLAAVIGVLDARVAQEAIGLAARVRALLRGLMR